MTDEFFTALVPMKGHSERVPNKNLRHLGGIPLYHYVMRSLLEIGKIGEVIVNTDSDNIKQNLRRHFPSVRIHDRPPSLCGDLIPMNAIIAYDLDHAPGELFCQTHSTNPFVRSSTIEAALRYFIGNQEEVDSLFSVTKHQARFYDSKGEPLNHSLKELRRTQDLPPIFEENSAFYIFTRNSFRNASHRIGANSRVFEVSPLEGLDIDEEYDFLLAEALVGHQGFSAAISR